MMLTIPGVYFWYMYLMEDSFVFWKQGQDQGQDQVEHEDYQEGRKSPHKDDVEANAGMVAQ